MDDRARALAELQAIAGEIDSAEQRVRELAGRRDELIRAAVTVGVPRRQIALAADISRSTVYAAAPTT
ncbi:MAG: hypothetical protein ACTHYO_16645 [Micrococcaceae bacterium]